MASKEIHGLRPKGPLTAPKQISHINYDTQLKGTKGELQIEPSSKRVDSNIKTFDSSVIPSPFLDARILQRKKEVAKNKNATKNTK